MVWVGKHRVPATFRWDQNVIPTHPSRPHQKTPIRLSLSNLPQTWHNRQITRVHSWHVEEINPPEEIVSSQVTQTYRGTVNIDRAPELIRHSYVTQTFDKDVYIHEAPAVIISSHITNIYKGDVHIWASSESISLSIQVRNIYHSALHIYTELDDRKRSTWIPASSLTAAEDQVNDESGSAPLPGNAGSHQSPSRIIPLRTRKVFKYKVAPR